jgi:hypothetical protein
MKGREGRQVGPTRSLRNSALLGFPLLRLCFRHSPRRRDFPDARISRKHHLTGTHRRLLEIRRIAGKNLPTRNFFSQDLHRAHMGKLRAQTGVMLFGGGQPNPVVRGVCRLVAQDENDFVFHVDREAAKHRVRARRQRRQCVEHKFMWHLGSRFGKQWIDQLAGSAFAAGRRHRCRNYTPEELAPFPTRNATSREELESEHCGVRGALRPQAQRRSPWQTRRKRQRKSAPIRTRSW